jgi:hypothetical protein
MIDDCGWSEGFGFGSGCLGIFEIRVFTGSCILGFIARFCLWTVMTYEWLVE